MKPLISIVIPVYNVEDFVGKCLSSVKKQKYENLDIVIVDDGSTDESSKICDEFAKNEKRARVFHKKNGGLSDARNFGIKKAKGEIIAFIDSDDFIDENFIDAMYEEMIRNDADIVVCGYDLVRPEPKTISGRDAVIKLLTKQENVDTVVWNKLYKKSLFINNDIWFPKGKKHEDTLITYKIFSKAKIVVYLDKSLYYYVDRSGSIMKTEKIEERLMMRELAAQEAIEFFKNNKDLKQAAEVALLLAKYAYIDFAINGKIEREYGELAKKWIKKYSKSIDNNKFLTKKLKIYNVMNNYLNGKIYWLFRKVVHE